MFFSHLLLGFSVKQKNNRSFNVLIALNHFITNILALFTVKMQVGNMLLMRFPQSSCCVCQVAARDAYLHCGSAGPTALLLVNHVIDKAREFNGKH